MWLQKVRSAAVNQNEYYRNVHCIRCQIVEVALDLTFRLYATILLDSLSATAMQAIFPLSYNHTASWALGINISK